MRGGLRSSRSAWWIVVGGVIGCATSGGVVTIYALAIFAKSFADEFGWDRSVYAFCLTAFLITTGFGTIWLGVLIGRWGVRGPSIALVSVFAACIGTLAILPPSPALFYAVFALLGLTGAAATAMPYSVAVSAWFDQHRGLALGLMSTGAGFGTILAPQLASYFDQHFGWRAGVLGVAVMVALAALPSLLFLVRDPPEDPIGRATQVSRQTTSTANDYLRTRAFWLIAIPMLGISIAIFGVTGSFVPMLSDRGLSPGTVAAVLSVSGVSSWVGRVLVGYAMDRVFAPYVAALTFAIALGGVLLIAAETSLSLALAGAVLIGFALGAEGDLITFLASRYFAMTQYSRVLGTLWVMWAWGGGLGTLLVGLTHRATSSYELALVLFSAVLVVSGFLVCRLGPYAYPSVQLT